MYIYRCEFELMENLFFASREVNNFFQTEAVIGNYALAYALGLCSAGYHNAAEITYAQDLEKLNEAGIYVTPGTLTEQPRFTVTRFNALSDSYWYQMEQNAISVNRKRIFNPRLKARATNFPQIGRLKLLSIGNKGVFYVTSRDEFRVPRYIRLGKFMSKTKISAYRQRYRQTHAEDVSYSNYLNPNDLPSNTQIGMFDLLNIRPAPLIRQVQLSGDFYELVEDKTLLPARMQFYTDF
ncbi:type I-D CRISPR-associated protein Cas5/Csc1 [Candidatus Poribacteria bacterium]|nr:type I-D CRISPR-associated protein Cas5/Csc1 [Candidatus Poribacteria bacterium]MYA57992.1 type I-D CRISPR-associated protein Cas5/Csc1 [Candidatus Poribacteria bacterium]